MIQMLMAGRIIIIHVFIIGIVIIFAVATVYGGVATISSVLMLITTKDFLLSTIGIVIVATTDARNCPI